MSDYRFGDEYKLSVYPKEAIGYGGELDMDKVESVEIDCVDFVRKSEDKSRWSKLFGTPERAALMAYKMSETCGIGCYGCPMDGVCDSYDALLEWLRGDA